MSHISGLFLTVIFTLIFCGGRVRTVRGEISLWAKLVLKQGLFTLFWHQQINCPSWAPGCSDWMCKEPWISKYDAHRRCERHLENENKLRNMQNMVRLHTEMGLKDVLLSNSQVGQGKNISQPRDHFLALMSVQFGMKFFKKTQILMFLSISEKRLPIQGTQLLGLVVP